MSDIAQSPEAVAWQLYLHVMNVENRSRRDREYILSTFVECLAAARGTYETPAQKDAFRKALELA